MRIIRDGQIVEDDWVHLDDEAPIPPGRKVSVSVARWTDDKAQLGGILPDALGLRVAGNESIESFVDGLPRFGLIVIEIPSMRDGRCFSLSRLLRERYGFKAEIRARGEFIRDQVFFLARVGVNAFECPNDRDLEGALTALTEFSVKYQAAWDEPKPLYRRRG